MATLTRKITIENGELVIIESTDAGPGETRWIIAPAQIAAHELEPAFKTMLEAAPKAMQDAVRALKPQPRSLIIAP